MPTMPALSLDQAFSVDPPIDLDRELDPAIHFGTISAGMVAAPVATSAHGHSGGDPKLVDNRVPAAEARNTANAPETHTIDMVGRRQSQRLQRPQDAPAMSGPAPAPAPALRVSSRYTAKPTEIVGTKQVQKVTRRRHG